MPCFVPFDDGFDISFVAIRPAGGSADELIAQMKYFSFHAEDLGCATSSIFQSIHGNMVIWYGAWMRRSDENVEILYATLLSALGRSAGLGTILHHGFFRAYAGESRDGKAAARFSSGDTILMGGAAPASEDSTDLSYANMALMKSGFAKMEGASAAVCLLGLDQPLVTAIHVWKSLESCYSWLLTSDYRNTIMPYISHLSEEIHFDVFKVVYVSNEGVPCIRYLEPSLTIGDKRDGEEYSVSATIRDQSAEIPRQLSIHSQPVDKIKN